MRASQGDMTCCVVTPTRTRSSRSIDLRLFMRLLLAGSNDFGMTVSRGDRTISVATEPGSGGTKSDEEAFRGGSGNDGPTAGVDESSRAVRSGGKTPR